MAKRKLTKEEVIGLVTKEAVDKNGVTLAVGDYVTHTDTFGKPVQVMSIEGQWITLKFLNDLGEPNEYPNHQRLAIESLCLMADDG